MNFYDRIINQDMVSSLEYLEKVQGNIKKLQPKRQENPLANGSESHSAHNPGIPSISNYLLELAKKIYNQLLGGRVPSVASKFISALIPKSQLSKSIVSDKIGESIHAKNYSHVVPTLLAASKKLIPGNLVHAEEIQNTSHQVVVKQVTQVVDIRLKASTNVINSLSQALFGTMNIRLQLSFRDVHGSLKVMAELISAMYQKVGVSEHPKLTTYILMSMVLASLLITLT